MQASDGYPAPLLAAFAAVRLGLSSDPSCRRDQLQARGLARGDDARAVVGAMLMALRTTRPQRK